MNIVRVSVERPALRADVQRMKWMGWFVIVSTCPRFNKAPIPRSLPLRPSSQAANLAIRLLTDWDAHCVSRQQAVRLAQGSLITACT